MKLVFSHPRGVGKNHTMQFLNTSFIITVVIKNPQWWDIVCSTIKDNICSLVELLCPPPLSSPPSPPRASLFNSSVFFCIGGFRLWEDLLFVQCAPDISSVLPRPPCVLCSLLLFIFFCNIYQMFRISNMWRKGRIRQNSAGVWWCSVDDKDRILFTLNAPHEIHPLTATGRQTSSQTFNLWHQTMT